MFAHSFPLWIRVGLVSVSMSLLCTVLPAQSGAPIQVNAAQMRTLAAEAVVSGNPQAGYDMASALLARNPKDAEALIIRARAARDMGRLPEAVATARRGWELAQTPSERYGASMVMAQSLATSGSRTRAQLWLRRAVQNAPNEDFKSIAIRDFQLVRRSNRWSTELNFAAAPSSNINNGSAKSTTQLFDLPFEFQLSGTARALSGTQFSGSVATRYRLAESSRSQHDLVGQVSHKTYTMSAEAKRLAPTSKGSDFAFSAVSLSYIRRGFTGAGNNLPNQFEATLGRTWYGGSPFMQYARFGFTQNYVFAPGSFVFGGVNAERQKSLSARQDVDSWGLSAGVRLTLQNSDQLTFTATTKRSTSLDANLDYRQVSLGVRYALSKPIAGMRFNFGLTAMSQDHERSNFTRFGRQDKSIALDVTAVFTQIDYFGFSPTMTITARRNSSNIGLYDSEEMGIGFGIQSAF